MGNKQSTLHYIMLLQCYVTNDKKTIYNEHIPNYRNLENTRKKKIAGTNISGQKWCQKKAQKTLHSQQDS
jgi:hypothetical protein